MSGVDLSVQVGNTSFKNPVMVASGTFGYGHEYERMFDISRLGAVITKGTTLEPRSGNPPPRIAETASGMLNAIGLENPGVDVFLDDYLPWLRARGVTVIVNLAGSSVEDYAATAHRLEEHEGITAIELNISCPNVKQGGLQFGTDPLMVRQVVEAVKAESSLPVWPKLSPNVTDIVAIAAAAIEGGADALSMINTLMGMSIDIEHRQPVLANKFGGLSGPAIKPVALRMIWQVRQAFDIPILGGGGIMNGHDALEFIMAGANAVSVGTANFINPLVALNIISELEQWMSVNRVDHLEEICGVAVVR